MDFKNEMEIYSSLRDLKARKEKIHDIISQIETTQKPNDPDTDLNMAVAIIEHCLLIENNNERLRQYDRATSLVQNVRHVSKEKNMIEQLLRSYHLECFIKFHTMKYKNEEASIQDILNFGGKIIETVNKTQKTTLNSEYNDYSSLGHVWRAYGFILHLIHRSKELSFKQKHNILETARESARKAVELIHSTTNRDAHILASYIFAFVEQLPQRAQYGDKTSTDADFIEYMRPYETLFEVARAYGAIEFEYLALLNYSRLNLQRVNYAAGVSEKKKEILSELLDDYKKLEKYENIIRIPHLHFYRYSLLTDIYTTIIYFEGVKEEKFNHYIDEAINSAEKMKQIYASAKMVGTRDKVEMHHILNLVYTMKASFATSYLEKIEYLKKSEELLLEDEKISATYSPQVYSTWRDLSSVYLDLSKIERDQAHYKKCVFYSEKAYNSALVTDEFKDAFFEAYKIALIAEDYQNYPLSIEYYERALQLINKIILAGKDYPYYHNLQTYIQARLKAVKAKESHRKGSYVQAVALYRKASSLLQSHDLYSYEAMLYKAYSLFEEASMNFIKERYSETLRILSRVIQLFDETVKHHAENYKPQFQYFIDRRAYELQQLIFESSKAFCIAQSCILKSLIYRNTGDSGKSVKLLREANALLKQFVDRNINIKGYYSFANGLYGLEKSEIAIKNGEYESAAMYLASASDQFENAAQVLATDERLRQLCEGLKFFCQGWMYALEILRRDTDLNLAELNTNFTFAHQFFENATSSLKMFKKTSSGVSGFEKLLKYIYYSLLFQKNDDPSEKNTLKDKMTAVLSEALQYFKDAEDRERYGFVRDSLATLPQLEAIEENVFKPIAIPFTPYTPVFDATTKFEPSSINFVISLDKAQVEVDEEIHYTIRINSDTLVYIKQIDDGFPKTGVKVISKMQLEMYGTIEVNRFLTPNNPIFIEFTVQASTPFYNRTHPRLIYLNTKNEKCRAFTSPLTLQVYPKQVLKTGVVSEINEKIGLVGDILEELGITLGEFPIIYHDINSYREALAEYYFRYETEESGKKPRSKKTDISKIPIQQMAFVEPLGEVNILYDLETYLYPQSIANLLGIIIHEKFGHGFFQQFTTLGKKLLELEYHHKGLELLMKELEKISNNTLIVDEGFATWLELKTFEKLLEKITDKDTQFIQHIHHEIERFKKTVFESEELNVRHDYFALKYEKPVVNPYALGYDLFSQIEEKYGEKCVPKALEIAANVPLTRRQISLMSNTIKNDKNCADKRLEKIARSDLKIARNNVDMFENAAKKLFL
jgi:hypothetical protein